MAEKKSSKVLIFTAPIFCHDCQHKRPNVAHKVGQPNVQAGNGWRKTTLKLRGSSFVSCQQQSSNYSDDDYTEESSIRLEYEPQAIQESVCFYLESEFQNTESSSSPAESSFGFETGWCATDENASERNLQKEFEDIRCASQRLLVVTGAQSSSSSTSSDEDKRGVKRKNDKLLDFDCDTDAHQLTMQDIYTQDKYPSASSDSFSSVKGTAKSKQLTSQVSSDTSPKRFDTASKLGQTLDYSVVPKVCDKLTSLKECITENAVVNILFVVIQVNGSRDVQIKSGASAGSFVDVSSLLVADESKSCFKLTMWREASWWTEKITPGDFAVATSIKVGKWRDEFVGQTTFNSGFYNLHQPKTVLSNICLKLVSQERLDTLVGWVRSVHPYFFAVSRINRNVKFTEIPQLQDNTLVHFRGKLIAVHRTAPSSNTYHFGGQQLAKITAVLAERPGDTVELFLWGRQAAWMNQLQEGLGRVWEFQYLMAKYKTETGCVSLHSTPRSTKLKLSLEDKNAGSIMSCFDNGAKQVRKFANLHDLLEAKLTGLAEVEAKIALLQFHCDLDEVLSFGRNVSTTDQLKEKIDKLVYVGCGSCSRALVQDRNGVYGQCSHCVATNSHYKYTIDYYYKPLTIVLGDSHDSLQVEAFSQVISHLFREFPAKTLVQRTTEGLSRDNSFVDSFVKRTEALSDGKKRKMLLGCRVTVDENSFVDNRTFTLREIDV